MSNVLSNVNLIVSRFFEQPKSISIYSDVEEKTDPY